MHTPLVPVVLVAMPWARLERPSIQLGILKALLDRVGIPSQPMHLYLDFAAHMLAAAGSLNFEAYERVAQHGFAGDWVFSDVAFPYSSIAASADYQAFLRREGVEEVIIDNIGLMRANVASFLDNMAASITANSPRIVGFTTTFGQTVSSIALARAIKLRAPESKIIFGGANCDGPMGVALIRNFPFIDVVVRGDAEPVLVRLVRELLDEQTPSMQPGLCFREGSGLSVSPMAPAQQMQVRARGMLDYDDYFRRVAVHPLVSEISPRVSIPFESSRGCWWGEKHHCTFCGLNGSAMTFRPMDPQDTLDEILYLAKRYQTLEFMAVDNIIDKMLFRTLLPKLAGLHYDFRLFYEVKANLTKSEIALMRSAGITQIQPGLESLSTAALRRMRKGTSTLQNIRLLKWCVAYGIKVHWNIIYNVPGSSADEYDEAAKVASNCYHLDPPTLAPLRVERFSPYHEEPTRFGIEVLGPAQDYSYSYKLPESELEQIAYCFEHTEKAANSNEKGLSHLRHVIEEWVAAAEAAGTGTLKMFRGPGFLVIRDRRPKREAADYRLAGIEAEIYSACDAGLGLASLQAMLSARCDAGVLTTFLDQLVALGLIYCESGRYLALAVESSIDPNKPQELRTQHTRRVISMSVADEPAAR